MSLMLPDPTVLLLGKYNVNSLFEIRWMTVNHDHRHMILVLITYTQWPSSTLYSTQAPLDTFEI